MRQPNAIYRQLHDLILELSDNVESGDPQRRDTATTVCHLCLGALEELRARAARRGDAFDEAAYEAAMEN